MNKKLIFLQNTRCAGNSLHNYLLETCGDKVIKFGVGVGGHLYDYSYILENINNPKIRFIFGHNVFGLHRHVKGDFEYFTSLRDPVKRLISGYSAWNEDLGKTITEWLNQSFELNNGFVKRLCGYGLFNDRVYDFTKDSYIDDKLVLNKGHLETAIQNIEKYHGAILFTEMFIESLLLFEEKYDLPPLFSLSMNYYNQTKMKLSEDEVDPSVVEYIRENNQLDYQLYNYFKEKVSKEIASRPKEFHDRVRIRKILSLMLKVSGKDQLSIQELNERVTTGAQKLVFFGMIDEFVEILKLIISKNNVSGYSSESLIRSVSPFIPKGAIAELTLLDDKK